MTDISAAAGLLGKNGRPLKFTPERIQQIRNLVERGMSREEIAEMLDVTVNSLQVTCSRLGLSLRRPRLQNGVKQNASSISQLDPAASTPPATNGNGVEPTNGAKPAKGPRPENSLAVVFRYRGEERVTKVPILAEDLSRFVFAAACCNRSLGDILADFVRAKINKLGVHDDE
jgi:hypothetical protein